MEQDKKTWRRGVQFAVLAAFCYGTLPVFSQMAYRTGIPVSTLLTGRFTMAVLLYFLHIIVRKRSVRVSRPQLWFLLAVGVLCGAANLIANESFRLLPGAVSSIIAMSFVVYVILMETVFGKEKLTRQRLTCLLLCFAGLVAITWTPTGPSQLSLYGIVMGSLGAMLDACQVLAISRPLIQNLTLDIVLFYISMPVIFLTMATSAIRGVPVILLEPSALAYMLLLAFVSSFVARMSFYNAVRLIGAGNASLIDTFEPLVAAVAGILLLGDRLTANVIVGSALILAGNIYLNRCNRAQAAQAAAATLPAEPSQNQQRQ